MGIGVGNAGASCYHITLLPCYSTLLLHCSYSSIRVSFVHPIHISFSATIPSSLRFYTTRSSTILSLGVLHHCYTAMWYHLAYHRQQPLGSPV
ncbi:hypothetical protein VNO80_24044 [Phaseolus coccineus]|uniref:Uncharacterized protein n=1 Tax=Phaseolus coccineus TaxID=3886 RepID=A0AAN9QMH7_PHACN